MSETGFETDFWKDAGSRKVGGCIVPGERATARWMVIDVVVRNQRGAPVATGVALVEFPPVE